LNLFLAMTRSSSESKIKAYRFLRFHPSERAEEVGTSIT
jgi:hypothetical protein